MATTIAAVSSPPGAGRRGVIRISGPDAAAVVRAALDDAALPPAGRAACTARFHDGRGTQPCLLLWMPGPASYTREDVAELHLPGAAPLLAAAFERLLALGCTPAAPGEFTRRAFLSGRLDLTQAEGVLQLIEAGGAADRRAALTLLEGGLTERLAALRDGLEELRALTEASLDFDESDTGHVPGADLVARAEDLRAGLARALAWEVRRQPPSALPRVALVGAPNAGKSTLFNALVPGGAALVSDAAGSTRDGVQGLWALAGGEVLLLDAPGLEPGAGAADRAAQQLAERERRAADLWLHVVDAAGPEGPELPLAAPPASLLVWSQTDRPGARPAPSGALAVAAGAGAGLGRLAESVAERLGLGARGAGPVSGGGAAGLARELSARHRRALQAASEELGRALDLLAAEAPLDLAADALRAATDALDGIEGRTTPEDLLDRIFARFCLGK
ncbi:MAG: GTPase [Planctomycetota bacterium]